MGAPVSKTLRYRAAHALQIRQDFIIPEAQHLESSRFHEAVTELVSFACIVLASIHFDDQSNFQAGEIGDVRPHGILAAESEAI